VKRRMGGEDFRSASPFEKGANSGSFHWMVCEKDYEIAEEDERLPYFTASSYERAKYYKPLVDTPHLFLEFARIAERRGRLDEGLDNWIRKYGLLGLSSQRPNEPLELSSHVDWALNADFYPEVIVPPLRYSAAGGPGDTLDAYRLEVAKANKLLTLYEALLNRDHEGLEKCFAFHARCTPEDLRKKWGAELEESVVEDIVHLKDFSIAFMPTLDDTLIYNWVPGDWNTLLMKRAIDEIWMTVGSALSVFALPAITYQEGSNPARMALSPDKLTSTWRVRNLLGAIYLQFFWLITSMSDLSRCKYCGRIISYAPPMPQSEKRKPRKDKEFCDSRCRQNYHYHNRIKPARNTI
jgi:hypothetical protein